MSDDEILEPLGISDENIWTPTGRRLEAMTKRQSSIVVILYVIAILLTGICALFFVPRYRGTVVQQFSDWNPTFQFNISDLTVFNDFLELNLHFDTFRQKHAGDSLLELDYELVTTSKGLEQTESMQTLSHMRATGMKVWSTNVVTFNELRMQLLMKIENVNALSGQFVWTFANPSHTIIHLLIRYAIFIASVAAIIGLLVHGIGSITLKMMLILNISLFLASNPFFIVTYYGDFTSVQFYDACMSMFSVVVIWFCCVCTLNLKKLTHSDVGFGWLLKRSVFFVIAFIAMIVSHLVSEDMQQVIEYVILFFITICLFMLMYSILTYKTDLLQERVAVIAVSVLGCSSTIWTKFTSVFDIEERCGRRVYSLILCAMYTFVFSFLNWPVDPSLALRDAENEPKSNGIEAETETLDLGMETPL